MKILLQVYVHKDSFNVLGYCSQCWFQIAPSTASIQSVSLALYKTGPGSKLYFFFQVSIFLLPSPGWEVKITNITTLRAGAQTKS